MAKLKKNAVNQILFTMVDKTDFATIEASLASDFTIKRIGVTHGSAAANISTVSRVPSKVGSGIYRLSLEAAVCNYDYLALRIAHASAATQILVYELATANDADLSGIISDAHSAAVKANSQLTLIQTALSDVESGVDDVYSMLGSRVTKEVANASQLLLVKSLASDAHSAAAQANSRTLVIESTLSDIQSAITVVGDIASDAHSAAAKANSQITVTQSSLSDVESGVDDVYSLLGSRVTKEVANASQLLLMKSTLSDTYSAATEARKILRNKLHIASDTGEAKLYDDDDSIMLSGAITADGDSTVRERLA